MPTKSAFSVVGLAHKLFLAAEAEGILEMLNALAESPSLLAGMRSVQRSCRHQAITPRHRLHDSPVFIPDGLERPAPMRTMTPISASSPTA